MEALCAGAGGEFITADIFQLHLEMQAGADTSRQCRRFLQHAWPGLRHIYSDILALCSPADNACCTCFGPCKQAAAARPDISSGGMPCKPFTRLRQQTGATPSTGLPHEHPQYETLAEDLPSYLKAKMPYSFWIEEVTTVTRIDPRTQDSYLNKLVEDVSKLGYFILALQVDHGIWCKNPRQRVFLFGVHGDAGGREAAEWALSALQHIFTARAASPLAAGILWTSAEKTNLSA